MLETMLERGEKYETGPHVDGVDGVSENGLQRGLWSRNGRSVRVSRCAFLKPTRKSFEAHASHSDQQLQQLQRRRQREQTGIGNKMQEQRRPTPSCPVARRHWRQAVQEVNQVPSVVADEEGAGGAGIRVDT
jgi:hypothetical protein